MYVIVYVNSKIPDCSTNQFACTSGGCVSDDEVCDYKMDCEDGSDEVDCGPIGG